MMLATGGSQGKPSGDFATAAGSAGEEQARDIDAADEQDQ